MGARGIAERAVWLSLVASLIWAPAASGADPTVTDGSVTSFDGTRIAYTLYMPAGAGPASPTPAVLVGHGWGANRGATGGQRRPLLEAGYAVLTWDARGFGDSEGEVNLDSQEYEVRDVQALIDLLAQTPGVRLDDAGDPRVGMTGGSYGGGIQLMAAAADRRIDAIAPGGSWHDLLGSLRPGDVLKSPALAVLYAQGTQGSRARLAPQLTQGFVESAAVGDWSDAIAEWISARSPARYLNGGSLSDGRTLPGAGAPTLIRQGAPDILFPLNEGIANYRALQARGIPVKLIASCSGHTYNPDPVCKQDDTDYAERATITWFERHLRGNQAADTGTRINAQTQDGPWYALAGLPVLRHGGEGTATVAGGGAATSGLGVAPQPSAEGIRIPLDVSAGSVLVGLPRVTATVSGTGSEASLFFKLLDIDLATGRVLVVDDQVMPQKVRDLSNQPQPFTIALGGIAWKVARDHELALEVSSSSNTHASPRTPFVAEVKASVELPAAPAANLSRIDARKLVLSAVSIKPRRWNPRRRKAVFRYALSHEARVRFSIARRARRARAARYRLVGRFTQRGRAGRNRRVFAGRLRGRTLRPGLYRATVRATDAVGNQSRKRRVRFRVLTNGRR